MSSNKKLIAIDSDGTLRQSNGEISKRTKNIINKLTNNGYIVVLCTARPRYHALDISNEIGIREYIISSNGAEIYDIENNKTIFETYISKSNCKMLYDYAVAKDIRIVFVSNNTEYVTQFTRNSHQILLTDKNLNNMLKDKVKQVMIIGKEKDKINAFKEIVISKYKMNVVDSSKSNKEEIWFSIIDTATSKGQAILELSRYLNISTKDTIAIGNDANDISMFKVAGISVAVGNAPDEVKNNANYVTTTNDEDGVALFLETLLKK